MKKGQHISSALNPYLNLKKLESRALTSPDHKLFVRYTALVAMLFLLGSYSPTNAFSDGSAYVNMDNLWDGTNIESPLMADQEGYLTKMNPQTSIGDRSTMSDFLVHTVASGETVSTIANSYNLHSATLLWANNISATSTIRIGQKLFVPPVDGVSHQINKTDTLEKIAKTYSVSAEAIQKQNSLSSDTLIAGDNIFIPGGKPLPVEEDTRAIGRETPARVNTTARVANVSSVVPAADGAILEGTKDVPIGDKPFIFPTRGGITQYFHAGHYAYDIGNRDRPAVWAAAAGTVVKVNSGCAEVSYSCGGGYGNNVLIDHGNGLQTLYAHLTYSTVNVGDQVEQGQVIGKMGRSGRVHGVTGIHLHWEVILNGVKVNPSKFYGKK